MMSTSRIAFATVCFLVFGGVALVMGLSARSGWREGRREGDRVTMFLALQEWWPAFISALVALIGPVIILTQR
jgi:hypothetical protein